MPTPEQQHDHRTRHGSMQSSANLSGYIVLARVTPDNSTSVGYQLVLLAPASIRGRPNFAFFDILPISNRRVWSVLP